MATPPNPLLKMHKPFGGANAPAQPVGGLPATGRPDQQSLGGKEDAVTAGYMELDGATKDADCSKVHVDGGVSSDLGCCNEFEPQQGAQEFKCGNCTYLTGGQAPGSVPDATGNSQPVVTGQPS